jgi:hypothetical protein
MKTCQTVGSVRNAARRGRMLSTGLVVWCCNILCREIVSEYMYVKCSHIVCFPTSVLAPHLGTRSKFCMHVHYYIVTVVQKMANLYFVWL